MTCCKNQQPRINERNGRVFCASCRQYIDGRSATPEPLREAVPAKMSNQSPSEDAQAPTQETDHGSH